MESPFSAESETGRIQDAAERINLIAAIDSSGRGGNLFFLTLFDRHPSVVCCPIVQYTYSYIMAEFGNAQAIDAKAAHEFITQKSYFRLLYNDPVGENGVLLTRMGGDPRAPIDRKRLRQLIDEYFSNRMAVTRKEAVTVPLIAYALVCGVDVSGIKYVLVADAISQRKEHVKAGFSAEIVERIIEDFRNAKLIHLVRDPRATFASPRHQFVNSLGNMYAIEPGRYFSRLWTLMKTDLRPDNGCVYLYWLMYLRQCEVAARTKAEIHAAQFMTIRNEDLNLNFPQTMVRISQWLGVEHLDGWKTPEFVPTISGVPWAGTGAYNSQYQRATRGLLPNDPDEVSSRVTGPNVYVTRRWRTRLNRREIELIEHLFRRDLEDYGYEILFDRPDRSDVASLLRTAVLPFEGEIPTMAWLKAGISIGGAEAWRRIFYAFTFPPFYLLSRIMLFDFVLRRHFFGSRSGPHTMHARCTES